MENIEVCPNCQKPSKLYNAEFDFWQCEICHNVWSDGLNDPDFEECDPDAQEAIAERNIELINQWNPE